MRATFLLASWFVFAVSIDAAGTVSNEASVPKFAGDKLPVPPEQKAAWKPKPGVVPERWIDAARALFEEGLADPRGGEYREIEVVTGSIWGGASVLATRGWVLPRRPPWQQDFAVCWDGLVHPVIKAGAPADFRADARDGVGPDNEPRRFSLAESERLLGRVGENVVGSAKLPLKACLLLRLGEPELARDATFMAMRRERDRWAWAREKANGKKDPPNEAVLDKKEDPYLEWARQWAWALWDRAVLAHMRGDDGLALSTLRQLASAHPAIRAEAGRRGFKPETVFDESQRVKAWPFLDWLREPFPRLLADQERRAKLPKRQPVVVAGLEKYPGKPARIAALIEDLQEVAMQQTSQPGGLDSYIEDATVKALVAEGADAAEPLLHAWATDGARLTRSVSYGRDFHPHRFLHPVSGPMIATLAALLQASPDDLDALPGGATPETVRAFWQKTKGVAPAERWFLTMADDHAGAKAWQQAAKEIVRPNNVKNLGNGRTTWMPLKPGEVAPMSGEPLRMKANPSLSELWANRAAEMRPSDEQIARNVFDLTYSCEFVANLARWDRAAAVKEATLHMALCRRHIEGHWGMAVPRGQRFVDFVARFALVRADSGDLAGLEEYCAWLAGAKSEPEGELFHRNHWMGWEAHGSMRWFRPLWQYAQNETVKATVLAIFGTANSPAGPLLKDRAKNDGPLAEFAQTPMLRFPEVRAHVLAALADQTEMGEAKVKYRICDFYAWQLARWEGMPAIDLTWPADKRDAAVAEAARLLREPGDLFDKNLPRELPTDRSDFGEEE